MWLSNALYVRHVTLNNSYSYKFTIKSVDLAWPELEIVTFGESFLCARSTPLAHYNAIVITSRNFTLQITRICKVCLNCSGVVSRLVGVT
jgi:hypothetical protein